eukprot:262628-Hanusia_phi.AAC.1
MDGNPSWQHIIAHCAWDTQGNCMLVSEGEEEGGEDEWNRRDRDDQEEVVAAEGERRGGHGSGSSEDGGVSVGREGGREEEEEEGEREGGGGGTVNGARTGRDQLLGGVRVRACRRTGEHHLQQAMRPPPLHHELR